MLQMPCHGRTTWSSTAPWPELAAEMERQLKNAGAAGVSRDAAGIRFERLPLRQLMPSLFIESGRFSMTSEQGRSHVAFSGSVALLPTLLHYAVVMLFMAGLAIHSGAPPLHVAGIVVLATAVFVLGLRAAAGAALKRLLGQARRTLRA